MIAVRDFVPKMIERGAFFREPTMEQLSDALAEVNAWVDEKGAEVLNIETVVLPNIHDPSEEGPKDPRLRTSGEMGSHWYQFIRVWYRI